LNLTPAIASFQIIIIPLADKYYIDSAKIQDSPHVPFSNAGGNLKLWDEEFPSGKDQINEDLFTFIKG